MENLQNIKQFFATDTFVKHVGIEIESVDGNNAVCTLKINENHYNSAKMIQGGVIFTLADFALAVASNLAGKLAVSQCNTITYVYASKEKFLRATARQVSRGKRTAYYVVDVCEDGGKLVAQMTATAYIKDIDNGLKI